MYICGDAGLPYGVVFEIPDSAKRSGAADIALPDKREGRGSPPKTEKGDQ